MATLEIRRGMVVEPSTVIRLASEAVGFNKVLGDPTKAA
jgi:hypothetical protein